MNKHGLTFLEFVIVMLVFGAVAYFIIYPKAVKLMEDSKYSMFESKVKEVRTMAAEDYLIQKSKFFSNVNSQGTKLSRLKDDEYQYYIILGNTGKVQKLIVVNKMYSFEKEDPNEILATDISSDDINKAKENTEFYLDSDGKINVKVLQQK